jgi:sulfotransferase family protein
MTVRIAMWSGPRTVSTALMRSFGSRPDTAVADEPLYAAYLAETGIDHPMRDEVLASQPTDWRVVVDTLVGPTPDGKAVFYQKHMAHHLLDGFGREWIDELRNAFLIRDPAAVLASYAEKRPEVTLADIGILRQRELFEREQERLGQTPPVVDSADVLADPPRVLSKLCSALGIEYLDSMLSWEPGPRATDGVWAPAWYAAVERSTGFVAPAERRETDLPEDLKKVADEAQPHYEALAAHRLH